MDYDLNIIAERLKGYVPSLYRDTPLHFLAYAKPFMLADGSSDSHWITAINAASRSLPHDAALAEKEVKEAAAKELNDPVILDFQKRREQANAKLEEAHREKLLADQAEENEVYQKHIAELKAKTKQDNLNLWSIDFEDEISQSKRVIIDYYNHKDKSPRDYSLLDQAIKRVTWLTVLKEAAPEEIKKYQ